MSDYVDCPECGGRGTVCWDDALTDDQRRGPCELDECASSCDCDEKCETCLGDGWILMDTQTTSATDRHRINAVHSTVRVTEPGRA